MIFIQIDKSDNRVISENYMPFDPRYGLNMTREQLEKIGYFVNYMPNPEVKVGKVPVKKFNTETKQIYFDYIDEVKTKEELLNEKVKRLEQENAQIQYALMMGGLL